MPWEKDSELWELDGLHFSRLGSQTLGRRLAEHLVPLLREREQSGGEPNRKKKRAGSAARGRRGCGEAACVWNCPPWVLYVCGFWLENHLRCFCQIPHMFSCKGTSLIMSYPIFFVHFNKPTRDPFGA